MLSRKEFIKLLAGKILITDGAMGTMLHARGLKANRLPEELNITNPETVKSVHEEYLKSGSNIIYTNTFGATPYKLKDYGLEGKTREINTAAVKIAKSAAAKYSSLAAGDIGPLGSFLTPIGTVDFDEAYENFEEQSSSFAEAGADLIILETFSDIRELKAALIASRDNFDGPIIASMTFTKEGRTVTGTDIKSFAVLAEALGADCIGLNCSVGPKHLLRLVKELCRNTNLPISVKPNRGIPKLINNETVFPGSVDEFARYAREYIKLGVNLLGGCCGTTPEFIAALSGLAKVKKPVKRNNKIPLRFSSRTKTVDINAAPGRNRRFYVIGERINPTGRKLLQEELRNGNFATVSADAKEQTNLGAHFLDINMGLAGGDEKTLMKKACEIAQSISDLPLCVDSSSADALETGLKESCGIPIINSVNGEKEKLSRILPLAKRFGAGIICLTMDEKGIPKTADERVGIARKIIGEAEKYGIHKNRLFIDNLTLSLSAEQSQAKETLKAIKLCSSRLKVKTVLGVSNISYGLPNRKLINSTFLNLARKSGLNFGIINPYHNWKIFNKLAYNAIIGKDKNCICYIKSNANKPQKMPSKAASAGQSEKPETALYDSILEGNKDNAVILTEKLILSGSSPLAINTDILIKALGAAGDRFEKKQMFLPQVLLTAETAGAAFSVLKKHIKTEDIKILGKVVLATVKGDIHDIGKNIVAAVMESHGFKVIDLGKNVDSQTIIDCAKSENADIIGLSALMTTTMPEMKTVINLKINLGLRTPVILGGAAVTRSYSAEIGADGYAKDALEAVSLAKSLIK